MKALEEEEEEEEEEYNDIDDEEGEYVNWNNIRLGALVIKHGHVLDLMDDDDEAWQ